jgi:hypothetical protein
MKLIIIAVLPLLLCNIGICLGLRIANIILGNKLQWTYKYALSVVYKYTTSGAIIGFLAGSAFSGYIYCYC